MRHRILVTIAICAGLAGRARAVENAPTPSQSDWVRADPDGALAADNPAAVERIQFGNNFQNAGMDQWCDALPFTIPISQDMVEELGPSSILTGGAFNGNRRFIRYPNGDVAINDQLELRLDLGFAQALISNAEKTLGVFFGGTIDGQSLVTRPVHGANSCKELKRFFNPFDFKTVLPLNAKRLGKMDVGELWMIPMTFQISFEPLDAAGSGGRTGGMPSAAYISLGASKTSDPTITVLRVGPKEMRLKLHLDQVRAFNGQIGAVVGPIPATDFATPGIETLLTRILPNVLPSSLLLFSRQIDCILGVETSLSGTATKGQQVLLQYTLDPTNPAQMALLAKVIRGDLSAVRAMKDLITFKTQDADSAAMLKALDQLHKSHDKALGVAADMAGIDDYKNFTGAFNFSFPVAGVYTRSTTSTKDHYVTQYPLASDINALKVLKQSDLGLINFPIIGSLINTSRAQGVQVLVDDSDAAGAAKGQPYLIYTREWGLLRARQSAIGKAVKQADALSGSVGGGSTPNETTRLPEDIRSSVGGAHYHKGYLDLSLVLGPKAVDEIVSASAAQVYKAFTATLSGGQSGLFDFILRKAKLDQDGVIQFGQPELNSYAEYQNARAAEQARLKSLADDLRKRAERFYRELKAVRAQAQDPVAQSQALFQLAVGKGSLGRDDFFKVAMALVSSGAVAGDVLLHLDADKTSSTNYTVRYVLNPLLFGDAALKGMATVERSFVAPTTSAPIND